MRRFFLRRVLLVLVGVFVLVFGASALAVSLFFRGSGSVAAAAVGGLVLLLFVGFGVGRSIRRMAAPIGDVMDAVDRLAAGDHAVRVRPRGPREVRGLGRAFNQMADRLEVAETERRNRFADVAHELRTPLMVIRGHAEGVLDGLYPADEDHLTPIVEGTSVMARLLDDLQTLSTAEAGALQLHRERVEAREIVEEAVAAHRARADAAGVALVEQAAPDLPPLDVDPVRVGEVLANLLTNAIRHSPSGGTVTVRTKATDQAVVFEVSDTGAGIAREDLPFVFDRFTRASDSVGAGLGLAIARSLVEAHGGEISAESEPGHGATMRFTVPMGR